MINSRSIITFFNVSLKNFFPYSDISMIQISCENDLILYKDQIIQDLDYILNSTSDPEELFDYFLFNLIH